MISPDSLQYLSDNLRTVIDIVELSNSTISNQISASSHFLSVVVVVVTIVGLLIGVYVTNTFNKVITIKQESDQILSKMSNIKADIDAVNKQINCDLEGLYQRLRNEETKNILDRLVEVPLDLCNTYMILLSRDIEECNFSRLKEAYHNLCDSGQENEILNPITGTYKDGYFLLLFQHFTYNTILDNELRDTLIEKFGGCINCAFKRDIVKSTKDLCRALSDTKAVFDKTHVLTAYLKSLNSSKYKEDKDLKNILETEINDITILPSAIEYLQGKGYQLIMFNL